MFDLIIFTCFCFLVLKDFMQLLSRIEMVFLLSKVGVLMSSLYSISLPNFVYLVENVSQLKWWGDFFLFVCLVVSARSIHNCPPLFWF